MVCFMKDYQLNPAVAAFCGSQFGPKYYDEVGSPRSINYKAVYVSNDEKADGESVVLLVHSLLS